MTSCAGVQHLGRGFKNDYYPKTLNPNRVSEETASWFPRAVCGATACGRLRGAVTGFGGL